MTDAEKIAALVKALEACRFELAVIAVHLTPRYKKNVDAAKDLAAETLARVQTK